MSSVSSAAPRSATVPEPKGFDAFLAIAMVAVIAACARALFFTPIDAMLGAAQKIFYVHVPAAIIANKSPPVASESPAALWAFFKVTP